MTSRALLLVCLSVFIALFCLVFALGRPVAVQNGRGGLVLGGPLVPSALEK